MVQNREEVLSKDPIYTGKRPKPIARLGSAAPQKEVIKTHPRQFPFLIVPKGRQAVQMSRLVLAFIGLGPEA